MKRSITTPFSVQIMSYLQASDTQIKKLARSPFESVQEKFVKNVIGLKGATYKEKLNEMGLCTLAERRMQLDLVECFKIVTGKSAVKYDTLFELMSNEERRNTRATTYEKNIVKPRAQTEVQRNFFLHRIVDPWNEKYI